MLLSLLFYVSSRVAAYPELDSRDYELRERYPNNDFSFDGRGLLRLNIRHDFSAGSLDEFNDVRNNDLALLDERIYQRLDLSPRFVQVVLGAAKKVAEQVAKQIVKQVIKSAIKAIGNLVKDIKDEKKNREIFVKNLLAGLVAKDSSFNYMIIHTKHTAKWEGIDGQHWHKEHVKCDTIHLLKKSVGYEVYAGKAGVVTNNGDGGFINWSFQGRFTRSGKSNNVVTFTA
ncbi:hypothetical protein C8J56DRAFT_1056841 [Mycena floridula]|nr:hypothetical protein C8J56DRAFT_1056841 [Mycena floridula]